MNNEACRRKGAPGAVCFMVLLAMIVFGAAVAAEPARAAFNSSFSTDSSHVAKVTPNLVAMGSLTYRPVLGCRPVYPTEGVRTTDGLYLSPALARLYGVRHVKLGRGGTALKGVGIGGKIALFSGAMASSFGLVDEKTALWIAGGAAVLGSIYGVTVGYEQDSWRDEWRWPEEREDDYP